MGKNNIFTTTVCPFFINTGMFDGVVTKWVTFVIKLYFLIYELVGLLNCRFPTILPILSPEYVADKITEAVLINSEVLYLPRLLYPMLLLKT